MIFFYFLLLVFDCLVIDFTWIFIGVGVPVKKRVQKGKKDGSRIDEFDS